MVKFGFRPDQLGVAAQDLAPIEWNVPSHGMPSRDRPTKTADPLPHLARRLVGEGDGEDFVGARAARRDDMGEPGGQHPRLAGARAGQHQHRTVDRLDRRAAARRSARRDRGRPRAGEGRAGLGEARRAPATAVTTAGSDASERCGTN